MPYQPHQKTDKSPEELAQQREVWLRIRMANAYLKEGAVEKALGYMLSVLEMDSVAHKTRTRVAQSILANAGRMGDRGPQVTVDARSQQLTIADLARLAPCIGPIGLEAPNGASPVSPPLRTGCEAPTGDLPDVHRSQEPVEMAPPGDMHRSPEPALTNRLETSPAPAVPTTPVAADDAPSPAAPEVSPWPGTGMDAAEGAG